MPGDVPMPGPGKLVLPDGQPDVVQDLQGGRQDEDEPDGAQGMRLQQLQLRDIWDAVTQTVVKAYRPLQVWLKMWAKELSSSK